MHVVAAGRADGSEQGLAARAALKLREAQRLAYYGSDVDSHRLPHFGLAPQQDDAAAGGLAAAARSAVEGKYTSQEPREPAERFEALYLDSLSRQRRRSQAQEQQQALEAEALSQLQPPSNHRSWEPAWAEAQLRRHHRRQRDLQTRRVFEACQREREFRRHCTFAPKRVAKTVEQLRRAEARRLLSGLATRQRAALKSLLAARALEEEQQQLQHLQKEQQQQCMSGRGPGSARSDAVQESSVRDTSRSARDTSRSSQASSGTRRWRLQVYADATMAASKGEGEPSDVSTSQSTIECIDDGDDLTSSSQSLGSSVSRNALLDLIEVDSEARAALEDSKLTDSIEALCVEFGFDFDLVEKIQKDELLRGSCSPIGRAAFGGA